MHYVTVRFLRIAFLLPLLFVFAACSSIVRKPEINGIKTVAIVSLYANEMVPWTGGKGRVTGWSRETKQRVAINAIRAYVNEFKKLGWNVVHFRDVLSHPDYKKLFPDPGIKVEKADLGKIGDILSNADASRPFTANGMVPIRWDASGRRIASINVFSGEVSEKTDTKTKLSEFAKTIHVDAVVVIYLDYCYTGDIAVLGNGTAKMTAGAWMKAVTPENLVVVDMPPIKKRCEGERGESKTVTTMIKGDLFLSKNLLTDRVVTMFAEASEKVAALNVAAIAEAMK